MKYNEYKVLETNKRGKILKKELTKRNHVMISVLDAREMNADYVKTKLFYEKVKEVKTK